MTEEKDINTESVTETTHETVEKTEEIVAPTLPADTKGTDRATHKPSNLRGRWKRNSAGTATIKEDDSKLPKEIKAVKITAAERINKNPGKKRSSSYEKTVKCSTQKKCCCCSFVCKLKRFILSLFGFEPKMNDKNHTTSPQGHRYSQQRRRGNYRSNSRNQTR